MLPEPSSTKAISVPASSNKHKRQKDIIYNYDLYENLICSKDVQ